MIDLKALREDPEAFRSSQKVRGGDVDVIDKLLAADDLRREAIANFEGLRAEQNTLSKSVGAAKGLSKGDYDAAIAAPIAAKNYNLKVITENIGDNSGAVTRFVVVEKPNKVPTPTGKDRTSMVVFIAIDHAGALLEILNEFAKHQVNLTFIQSRPTGVGLGHYHFIIDVEGHIQDEAISATLTGLKQICEDVRFLGSYPQAK